MCTPASLFLICLVITACQTFRASSLEDNFGAYIPTPPMLQPVSWNAEPISIYTDQIDLLGDDSNSYIKPQTNHNFSYFGKSHLPPKGFSLPSYSQSFCLPTAIKAVMI